MKRFIIALSLILVITFSLAGLYNYLEHRSRRLNAEAHAMSEQHGRLIHVIQGLDFLIIDDPFVISELVVGKEYSGSQISAIMRKSKKAESLMQFMHGGEIFLDVWGKPVKVRFEAFNISSASARVTVWSTGPNGVDENGKGDDVVTSDIVGSR